jgi:hypothetical protein
MTSIHIRTKFSSRLVYAAISLAAFGFTPTPMMAQCGADCTVPVSLCSNHSSCMSAACIDTYCDPDDCPDCQSEEAGLCSCPGGGEVSPDTCGILGDCNVCTFLRRPSRPWDADDKLLDRLILPPPVDQSNATRTKTSTSLGAPNEKGSGSASAGIGDSKASSKAPRVAATNAEERSAAQ